MSSARTVGSRRLYSLFQQSREPVFLLDADGRFAYVNPSWEILTSLKLDAVIGRTPLSLEATFPTTIFEPPADALNGTSVAGLVPIPSGDATPRRIRIEFSPFGGSSETSAGILGIVRTAGTASALPESPGFEARTALAEARQTLRSQHGDESLIGRGPRHERLLEQVVSASLGRSPVLIVGESGTGKRLVAGLIHRRGTAVEAPLRVLDIEALSPDQQERWLFDETAIERPSSILLHKVENLPRDIQERLLRERLHPDFPRLLFTTATDPEASHREGRFRDDFYYAISVTVIRIDPLRERRDEIPLLAQHFLEAVNRREPVRRREWTVEALDQLTAYDWPGNLGELSRVIDSAHAKATGHEILAADLPSEIRDVAASFATIPRLPTSTPIDEWLGRVERHLIEQALQNARQNKTRAAEMLRISRPRLHRRIKELGIADDSSASEEEPEG